MVKMARAGEAASDCGGGGPALLVQHVEHRVLLDVNCMVFFGGHATLHAGQASKHVATAASGIITTSPLICLLPSSSSSSSGQSRPSVAWPIIVLWMGKILSAEGAMDAASGRQTASTRPL